VSQKKQEKRGTRKGLTKNVSQNQQRREGKGERSSRRGQQSGTRVGKEKKKKKTWGWSTRFLHTPDAFRNTTSRKKGRRMGGPFGWKASGGQEKGNAIEKP